MWRPLFTEMSFLGGIVDEHFLICPIEHYQCGLGQPQEVIQEVNQFKEALRKFYDRKGQVAVFFERNYKTSHMQLQAVPLPKKATKELKEIFMVGGVLTTFVYFRRFHLGGSRRERFETRTLGLTQST